MFWQCLEIKGLFKGEMEAKAQMLISLLLLLQHTCASPPAAQ